jgi:hypothetical protein
MMINTPEYVIEKLLTNFDFNIVITNTQIQQHVEMNCHGQTISGNRVRDLIHDLRIRKMPELIASSNGYWRSDDPTEIKNYILSLKNRAASILSVATAMENNLCEN